MTRWLRFLLLILLVTTWPSSAFGDAGITAEQIFQTNIDWKIVTGTWEVLPEENPLSENGKTQSKASHRALMTLRKDGTCRVFNKLYPAGSDAIWTLEDHKLFITFPNGSLAEHYVYGVRGDFMITRTPASNGTDKLWSRVK